MAREILKIPDGLHGFVNLVLSPPTQPASATHTHREPEANLVLRGRARYLLGNRSCELSSRTLIWLFPAQEHVLVDPSPDFEMWCAVWRPDLVRQYAGDPRYATLREENPAGIFLTKLSQATLRRLAALTEEVQSAEKDGPRYNAGLGFLLLQFWAAFGSARRGPDPREVHPAVDEAARILREEGRIAGLAELARRVHLSSSRLSRLFYRQTGLTLIAYRNRCRVERFLAYYGLGQRVNMLEAACEAGFGSYAQFYRVFRQVMGKTPNEYRRGL
jgi:AraC-like DNA-binding protein